MDEYSRMCLAIRVGRRSKVFDVIDSIEELFNQYPALPICEWTMAPSSLPMLYRSGTQGVDQVRNISLEVHLERIHSWSHSTADLGTNSCRRSRQEATHQDLLIVIGSEGIGRAAHNVILNLECIQCSRGLRPWRPSSSGERPD